MYANVFKVIYSKQISEAIATFNVIVDSVFGIPVSVSSGGMSIDVDRDQYSPISMSGDQARLRDFMIISGLTSSAWEHRTFEVFLDSESISAVKLLKYAKQQSIPVHTIDGSNIGQILPLLQVAQEVKDDVINGVNSGKIVMIPQEEITLNDWLGVGYIVLDPITGDGAYIISGGLAGGETIDRVPISGYIKSSFTVIGALLLKRAIVVAAESLVGTPYVWGGDTEVCGMDCSGFVHHVFTTVFGDRIFTERKSAKEQHRVFRSQAWVFSLGDRIFGDILWKSDDGHTGIYMGERLGKFGEVEAVAHATGAPCKDQQDPDGWLPSSEIQPEACEKIDPYIFLDTLICGAYRRVTITPLDCDNFPCGENLSSEVGWPIP